MKSMKKLMIVFALLLAAACTLFAQQTQGNAMVLVEGGTFQMGEGVVGGFFGKGPVHTVVINSFYMSRYEVTQREWREMIGSTPSHFTGDNLPVENVSWSQAVAYCNLRSIKEGLTQVYRGLDKPDSITCNWNANGYRLPTEAEWEYAARGGRNQNLYAYSGSNDVDAVAWHETNSGGRTQPVGQKQPNALGLYDMCGNVWEWCWNWFDKNYYASSPVNNPRGWDPQGALYQSRVVRGGCWSYVLGVTSRGARPPAHRENIIGFRVVRNAQ